MCSMDFYPTVCAYLLISYIMNISVLGVTVEDCSNAAEMGGGGI